MKRALVLGGGGAKGSYQAGCIKALNELDIKFDIVTGTSIGALHTLLYVMGKSDLLDKLWHTITIEDIIKDPIDLPDSIDDVFSDMGEITSFLKKYISNKGINIEPLKSLLNKLYDPKLIESCKYDYGFVTMEYPQLKPLLITNKQMNINNTLNYALASASCFPIFPIEYIEQQGYIDGGYYDNLPIELALSLGADEIVAIPLSKKSLHYQYLNRPTIKYIMPSIKLGDMLDFNRNLIDFQYTLGYNDTCKAYGKYVGFYYTFEKLLKDDLKFYKNVLEFENAYCKYSKKDILPITSFLIKHSSIYTLKINDYSIVALESILRLNQALQTNIYNYYKEKKIFYIHFYNQYKLINFNKKFNTSTIEQMIFYYYYLLETNQFNKIFQDCNKNQQAIVIALYYFSI